MNLVAFVVEITGTTMWTGTMEKVIQEASYTELHTSDQPCLALGSILRLVHLFR